MKYTEIDQNRIIILQKTYNPGALHQTSDRHHTQTEIHTFFIWYPRVGREHNSPSGKNVSGKAPNCEILLTVLIEPVATVGELVRNGRN